MTRARVRVPLVILSALVVNLVLLARFHPAYVHGDALLLVAVAAGVVATPDRAAVIGFLAGVTADLFLDSPFGLSGLVFALVAFAVSSLQSGILRAAWWIPVVTALAASAAGVVLFALVGMMVGQPHPLTARLPVIALIVGAINAAVSPAALRLVAWSLRGSPADRSLVGG